MGRLNAVKNKWEYLDRLKSAVERLPKCSACYLRTQLVDETARGKAVWVGDVEVFALTRHPKARRGYTWSRCEGKNEKDERFVAKLRIPPAVSPQTAVRISIDADVGKQKI